MLCYVILLYLVYLNFIFLKTSQKTYNLLIFNSAYNSKSSYFEKSYRNCTFFFQSACRRSELKGMLGYLSWRDVLKRKLTLAVSSGDAEAEASVQSVSDSQCES